MNVPLRQPWLRSCDWFLICTSLIVTVARSSSAILMSAGEDSLFVNFLSLCIFIVLVVDVIGSVLWMVLTLSTEPFVVEEQHEEPDGEKFAARSDDVDRERSASGNRSNLSARKYSINKGNKKESEEQSTQSAPQLSTLSGGGTNSRSEKSKSIDTKEDNYSKIKSPPSSPFMKISPFNANEGTVGDNVEASIGSMEKKSGMSENKALSSLSTSVLPEILPISKTALIIDIGSTFIRFGFAGEIKPTLIIRTSDAIEDINRGRDESKLALSIYSGTGRILSIEHYIEIVKYAYSLLMTSGAVGGTGGRTEKTGSKGLRSVDSTKHPLLICWPVYAPIDDAVEVTSGLFDALDVPLIHYAPAPVLALYASGRQTGCSILSGHFYTTTVCVVDGLALEGTLVSSSLAGNYVSENLSKKLGAGTHNGATMARVHELKESSILCSKSRQQASPRIQNGALIPENEENDSENENVEAVVGGGGEGWIEHLSTEERKQCAEGLFRRKGSFLPHGTISMEPLQNGVITSIATAQTKYKIGDGWWGNIVLSGGNAKIKNLRDRLDNELKANTQLPRKEVITISSMPGDSANAVWLGGSVLAKLDGFGQDHWISTTSFADNRKEALSDRCQFLVTTKE